MKGKGRILYETFFASELAAGYAPPWDHLQAEVCGLWDAAYGAAVQDFLKGISLDVDTSQWGRDERL